MTRILKEPFIHFLLIGAVVFAGSYIWRDTDNASNANSGCKTEVDTDIVITPQLVKSLDANDSAPTASPPGAPTAPTQTLDEKVNAYITDEILYREGLTRGLDKDDAAMRGRVIEKMRLIATEQASTDPIPEKEIEAYYNQNRDSFSWPGRASIAQLFFDSKKRGEAAVKADCEAAWQRVQLEPDTPPEALSAIADRKHGLRTYMALLDEDKLSELFGPGNAEQILTVNSPGWIAPIKGPMGWHLIRVTEIVHAGTSTLTAMRSQIEKQLEKKRNLKAVEDFAKGLKKKYRVIRQ